MQLELIGSSIVRQISALNESVCVICRGNLTDHSEDCIQLTAKGLDTLLQYSELRDDVLLICCVSRVM